jgi:hypothetical protein
MARRRQPEPQFSIKLSHAQRKVLAEIVPKMAKRLQLDGRGQRIISFTLAELKTVKNNAELALRQVGTGRSRIPLQYVIKACGQALDQQRAARTQPELNQPPDSPARPERDQQPGTPALPEANQQPGTPPLSEAGIRDWFLTELRAVASRYHWQYVAPDRQAQIEQIAYRIWQEEGYPKGREQEHWWRAEKQFHANKLIRGATFEGEIKGQGCQFLSPWQAVVHAKTGVNGLASSLAKLAEIGISVTPGEVGAIEAAADASSEGYSASLRTAIAMAVGLES